MEQLLLNHFRSLLPEFASFHRPRVRPKNCLQSYISDMIKSDPDPDQILTEIILLGLICELRYGLLNAKIMQYSTMQKKEFK